MKKLSALLSVSCVTALAFYGLSAISKENEYTSVRKYSKPKPATLVVPANASQTEADWETGAVSDSGTSEPVAEESIPTISDSWSSDTGTSDVPEDAVSDNPAPAGSDVTPPTVEFADYQDGDVVTVASVDIRAEITDDVSPLEKIKVEWTGKHDLKVGFNPIVVSAVDEAGNASHSYIILERR